MMPFHRLFLFAFLVSAFPVLPSAASPVLELAQSVPVWEPGDPVPDAGPDTGMTDATLDYEAEDAEMAPAPLPKGPPLRQSAASESEASVPGESGEGSGSTASIAEDPTDFLCGRAPAGKTAPVPQPFDRWLVRVCSPKGQALVPVQGEAWVAHGSADPVSILAMPPGAVPPPADATFDARYDIRFETLVGGQTAEKRLARASALIEAAAGEDEKTPPHDEVWQLDAVSNVGGAHYNIFFYVAGASAEGARPHHLIACLDQCRQALYLDVLTGAEAAEVTGR
ncbi:MAG: hypothetical protein RIF42_12835 [Parvibaculaceae bacterium]